MSNSTPKTLIQARRLIGVSTLLSALLFLYQLFGNEVTYLLGLHKMGLSPKINSWLMVINIFFFILISLSYFNLESGVNPKALSLYLLLGSYLLLPLLALYFVNRTESKAFYRNVLSKNLHRRR